MAQHPLDVFTWNDMDAFDGEGSYDDTCEKCGGEGFVELHDHPEMWGEDSCSEENQLLTCPRCKGRGHVL